MSLTLAELYDLLSTGELAEMQVGGHQPTDPITLTDEAYHSQNAPQATSAEIPSVFELYDSGRSLTSGTTVSGADQIDGEPAIRESDRPAIARHIILGLQALYRRFHLADDVLQLKLVPGQHLYELSPAPERGQILKIDAVHVPLARQIREADQWSCSRELGLNTRFDERAVTTPRFDKLLVPTQLLGELFSPECHDPVAQPPTLTVHYRAHHPRITLSDAVHSPSSVLIELPAAYIQALLFFVASRVMNPVGMVDEFHAGNTYAAKFEQECQMLEAHNLDIDDAGHRGRFDAQGFM